MVGTYAEPSRAVLGLNLLTVGNPVAVPLPQRRRVVHTDGVDALDLEAGGLKRVRDVAERSRGVGTGEDVLVHEQTPDEILVLPVLAEAGVLQEEHTVVVEHLVHLPEESTQLANTDVLGHLQTRDLLVAALGDRDVSVVHAKDLALLLGNADVAHGLVAPGGLVAAERNTRDLSSVVDTGEAREGAPTAADVEQRIALLETDLLTDNGELVVLDLLQRLLFLDIGDDAGRVDHAGTEEPAVEVVTAVVVVTALLLVFMSMLESRSSSPMGREVFGIVS